MEVKYLKLIDICEKIVDCPHESPSWLNEGVPVIRNFNLVNGRIDFSNGYYVDEKTYLKRIKRAIPQEGDIVFSREAPIGNCAIIPKDFKCCLGQRLVLLRVKKEICSPEYLLAALMSEPVKKQIRGVNNSGSIVSNYDIGDLKELLIPIVKEQDYIASVSGLANSKIINNDNISNELEKMCLINFDRLFVDYGTVSVDDIEYNEALGRNAPKKWKVVKLGSILKESKKSKIQVSGAKQEGQFPFFTSGEGIIRFDEFFVDGFNLYLNTGGNPGVKGFLGKAAYSTDTWCISAGEYTYYLYYYFQKIYNQMETLFFAGSGLKHLQKDAFKSQYIVLPPEELLTEFNIIAELYFQNFSKSLEENLLMQRLSDFIVPYTMSGVISYLPSNIES